MDLMTRRRDLMGLLTEIETMKLIKTVTLTESYESDSNGNAQNFRSMLFDEYKTEPNNLYVAVFENNNASYQAYKTDVMYTLIINGQYNNNLYVRNNFSSVQTQFGTNYSAWASEGTIIKVYAAR